MNQRTAHPTRVRRNFTALQPLESRRLFSFVIQPATVISATAAAGPFQSEQTNPAHAESTFSVPGSEFQPAYSLDATANASYQGTPQQLTIHDDATQSSTPAGSLWPDDSGASSGVSLYFTLTSAATVQIHGALSSTRGGDASISLENFRADSSNTTAFNQALHLPAGQYTLFTTADAADQAGPSDSSASLDVTLTLSGGTPPQITSPNNATFRLGIPAHFTVTTAGSPTPAIKETAFLPAGITFVDNHDGTATLSGTPKLSDAAGHYDLIFSASNGVSISPTQPAANQFFTLTLTGSPVTTIVPTKVAFTAQPASTTAGHALAPIRFSLQDNAGHLAANNNSLVTLTLAGAPAGTLHGTTSVHAINGVATFSNLSITTAGTYTLTATDGSLSSAHSQSFTINPDATSAHLVLAQAPAKSVLVGKPLTPINATLKDKFGNIIRNNQSAVTLSVAKGPTNGKLAGATTLKLANGTVTFKNASLTLPGPYTLQLLDNSLPHTTYPPPTFPVTAARPTPTA